ncbi:hypothetical protein M4I74_12255 [Enterococcus faecium]|uniref:hypothetical protein n=1 Tax=Enterococcus TaxID=1350 RepID=UPI0019E93391|nr:hypothetical protein [Enterococcus faecium]EGP4746872.1 DegT/DnrJ/EryC1/StrS aminotransferase family protein [Enterococcus faecium]EGP5210552.1 DegT/DnrJ/EryC1/StrS aminotransferase family protein [Enterococcus faecium]EME3521779.1 DegT/DnrJ/EryC1/StrS aminotransferase family protein [Enterococcus faecium]EMF0348999.1 DegT/DnrJ/EryC1/StrS aminotransferase family protein [Enterococcus faecium]MCO5532737.1 hypothetical protein [Enterococcus faecium]
MQKEIGSNFWAEKSPFQNVDIDTTIFNVNYDDISYTSSGRDAIKLVLGDIDQNKRKVLLPEFTCDSVIQPFVDINCEISFYPINTDLSINKFLFENRVFSFKPDIIYIHNYFGFNTSSTIRNVLDNIDRNDVIIIEDITQALYSSYERIKSNYFIGSFRKWAGIPDGGFAIKKEGKIKNKPQRVSNKFLKIKIEAMELKNKYMSLGVGVKDDFLRRYAEAERTLDTQKHIYRMSDYSLKLQAGLDIEKICRKRRANYEALLDSLRESNRLSIVFDSLPDDVVPLYFPILCVESRNQIQTLLRNHMIYAPIVWPQSDFISQLNNDTEFVYTKILCIPCDQRYDIDDMDKIISVLNNREG